MSTIHDKIREHLLRDTDLSQTGHLKLSLEDIRNSQVSAEFRTRQDERMVMGAFRYGLFNKDGTQTKAYDNTGSIKRRVDLYTKTGNLEHLVDAANICMVEYMTSQHPNKHFESADDGEHTKELK